MGTLKRLDATDKAKELIRELADEFGDLMFYQAGGCCEGTQPMCYMKGDYIPRTADVKIGEVCGYEFWVDRDLFEYWRNAHFTLDVLDGFGTGGFSLEMPRGKTFKVHYRIFSPEELEQLEELTYFE